MTLLTLAALARLRTRLGGRWACDLLVLAGCAAFMFLDRRTAPIVIWDESRMAVNALEMHLQGHLSLVTTYGFRPDLWNTKPPLLIWLMDLSMGAFGPSEASLRLPSMTAALATVAMTLSFTRRATGSMLTSAGAAMLLSLSLLFFGEHGARTADYEALLTCLTTAYLYVLFFALHRRRPGWRRVMLAGGLVALAVLTKSIAGLVPGLGVAAYLLLVGRWRRPLQSPWYAAAGLLTVATGAAWFGLRELAAPGYLQAMAFNDVSGRFGRALDQHSGPPWYYLDKLFMVGTFSAGPLAAAGPLALMAARGRAGLALLYSLCVAGGVIALLSLSSTKLVHYAVTACPFLAVATAIAAREVVGALDRAYRSGRMTLFSPTVTRGVVVALLLGVAARAAYARYLLLPRHEVYPQANYGELFRELRSRGVRTVRVVDDGLAGWRGVVAVGVPRDYAPQLDFYRLLMGAQGMQVGRIGPADLEGNHARGVDLASCDPRYTPRLTAMGAAPTAAPGCVATQPPVLRPRA